MDLGRRYTFAVLLALACSSGKRFSPFSEEGVAGGAGAGAGGSAGGSGGSSAGSTSGTGGMVATAGSGSAGAGASAGSSSGGAPVCAPGQSEEQTRYQTATVPFGGQCVAEVQVRTCSVAGWGDFSGTYAEASCGMDAALACGEIGHAAVQHRVRYEAELVPFGAECEQEIQSALCNNGELGEWTGSFSYEECIVGSAVDCTDASHGATKERIRFATATVPFGQECQQEIQTAVCENGSFSPWSGSYTFQVCTVDAPADCDGGAHGTSRQRVRYADASVSYGESCVQETQTQDCSNGTWSAWTGSYDNPSCSVGAAASCGGVAHGDSESRVRYESAEVAYGSDCVSEQQSRTCDNGTWGSWTGSYTFDACSVAECENGGSESKSCGINGRGESTRTCVSGSWGDWSECDDPDECSDGDDDVLSCEPDAGYEVLTCIEGAWQSSGCGSCSGFDAECEGFTTELACAQAGCDWSWHS
ncbi:MAG TPA: hypothetical protein VM686_24290 [Polyangiaceae bacterium]|nr:hypothetical protein [Polyangiaceae bacterium]